MWGERGKKTQKSRRESNKRGRFWERTEGFWEKKQKETDEHQRASVQPHKGRKTKEREKGKEKVQYKSPAKRENRRVNETIAKVTHIPPVKKNYAWGDSKTEKK